MANQLAVTRERVIIFNVKQYLLEETLIQYETWLKENSYSTILDYSYKKDVTSSQYLFYYIYYSLREAIYTYIENQLGVLYKLLKPRYTRIDNIRGVYGIIGYYRMGRVGFLQVYIASYRLQYIQQKRYQLLVISFLYK